MSANNSGLFITINLAGELRQLELDQTSRRRRRWAAANSSNIRALALLKSRLVVVVVAAAAQLGRLASCSRRRSCSLGGYSRDSPHTTAATLARPLAARRPNSVECCLVQPFGRRCACSCRKEKN